MKIAILLTLGVLTLGEAVSASVLPVQLRCEYLKNPHIVDIPNPRLSWINSDPGYTESDPGSLADQGCCTQKDLLNGKADLWNSGKVLSDQSVNIVYKGKTLHSRQDCWWQVRTWDKKGRISEWSEPAFWSMGLLDPREWKAKWIGAPWQGEEPIPDNERPMTPQGDRRQKITEISELTSPLLRRCSEKDFRI